MVEAARVTSGTLSKEGRRPDRDLIRYLMRHDHMSPFEFCQLEFHIRAPIYVARQWVRHRTASWNEVSGRYVEFEDDYQRQEQWRGQAENNRQGSDGVVEHKPVNFELDCAEDIAFYEYKARLRHGVAREQARTCLPLSTWTEWRWSVDLRNCLHFLGLRASQDAQPEIRAYAHAMVPMVESVAPLAVQAWRDYKLNAITLSDIDLFALFKYPLGTNEPDELLKNLVKHCGMSSGEAKEHLDKRRLLLGIRSTRRAHSQPCQDNDAIDASIVASELAKVHRGMSGRPTGKEGLIP